MAVLIRNMQNVPDCCDNCPFCRENKSVDKSDVGRVYCCITPPLMPLVFTNLPPQMCPLISVDTISEAVSNIDTDKYTGTMVKDIVMKILDVFANM